MWKSLFLAILASFIGGSGFAASPVKPVLVAEMSQPQKAEQYLHKLLENASQATLRDRIDDEDPSVALAAAWKLHYRPVLVLRGGGRGADPDPKGLQRFLGILEGKFKIRIPEWWEGNLAGTARFPILKRPGHGEFTINDGKSRIFEDKDDYVLKYGSQTIRFQQSRLNTDNLFAERFPILAVYATETTLAIIPYQDVWIRQCDLVCINIKSSTVTWRATTWGTRSARLFAVTGSNHHHLSIDIRDGKVWVFGADSLNNYLEAFRLSDGKPVLRFATDLAGPE